MVLAALPFLWYCGRFVRLVYYLGNELRFGIGSLTTKKRIDRRCLFSTIFNKKSEKEAEFEEKDKDNGYHEEREPARPAGFHSEKEHFGWNLGRRAFLTESKIDLVIIVKISSLEFTTTRDISFE